MAFTEEQQAAIDEANLRASQANANYSPEQQAAIDEAEAKAGRGVVEKSVNWLFGGEREENIPTLFDGGNAGMGAFNWPKGKKTKVVSHKKKAPAATLRTEKTIFFIKKVPASMLRTRISFFS